MQLDRVSRRHGGLFWRLFLSLLALCVVAVAVLTWLFSNGYEGLLWRRVNEELRASASAAGELLARPWPAQPTAELQGLVRRTGERSGLRITLIAADGRVLADSAAADLAAVEGMEDHGNRVEFVSALHSGEGSARRQSPTLGEHFLYRAIRVADGDQVEGVVRTALPLTPVLKEIAGLNRWLYTLAALLAAASAALSYLLAIRLTEPLRQLQDTARQLAAGQYDRRPSMAAASGKAGDEVAAIAAALDDMGRRLAHSEGQLRSTSQTQTTVLEAMAESVIAVDRGERILLANAAAGRSLGFNPSAVNGRTLLEAVRSYELREALQQALRTRKLAKTELTWRSKPPRVFDVLATPLPGDPPAGVVLVLRDVSELKRLEQMRQQFVANVSHELKTPLSSIRAYTETLLAGARNDPLHCERFLGRIDEQASRLQELIFDMLSLARIEPSQAAVDIVDLPLAPVIERCLDDYEAQAAAKPLHLERAIDPDLRGAADEEALRQVLSNLVDNAIKYTPAGGRVAVRGRRDGERAVIEVEDTGPGIPAEHHARLFERFYRVDKARSRELGGTGLGLSIVKHLVQAMGGAVGLRSQVGTGSCFTVTLPARAAGTGKEFTVS